MLSPLCELVPDYAVGIITELVQGDLPDCIVAALRALHHIVTGTLTPADMAALLYPQQPSSTTTPGVQPASSAASGGVAAGPTGAVSAGSAVMLQELMRRGMHPIDVLGVGHTMSRLTAALSRVWQQWHMLYGTNAGKPSPGRYSFLSRVWYP